MDKMKQVGVVACEKTLKLVGVGYRVRWMEGNQSGLVFDVGKSHVETFTLPVNVGATIDPAGTKLVRTYLPSIVEGDLLGVRRAKERLGNTAYKIMRLRPRSPYTGNGILEDGVDYPKLMSTKTKAKK